MGAAFSYNPFRMDVYLNDPEVLAAYAYRLGCAEVYCNRVWPTVSQQHPASENTKQN